LRGLIFGPVEGIRVPSISIAISWMLTPLFYLFFPPAGGSVSKWETLQIS
jgi:hypothetical protein